MIRFEPKGLELDAKRTAYLEAQGLHILRFFNTDVTQHFRTET